MGMLRNRNHFVRVGSDGNMGVYDQRGNRFIRENTGSDGLPGQVVIIPSSTDNNDKTIPPERNAIGFMSDPSNNPRLNPTNDIILNLGVQGGAAAINNDFAQPLYFLNGGSKISYFMGVPTTLNAFSSMSGNPDLRTGITAADASPITIFSSTVAGTRYKIDASTIATAGIAATYVISWTEGGAARTVTLTITATGTLEFANFVIQPDAGTNITAQITSLTTSTINVVAIVSVLG